MLPTPALLDSLERRFGLTWLSNYGEQINVRCPYCHRRGLSEDRSGHLGINTRLNKAHCVKCDWGHGNASKWLESYDVHLSISVVDVVRNIEDLKNQLKTKDLVFDPITFDLPKEFQAIGGSQEDVFTDSLSQKGISKAQMLRHKIGYCDSGKYEGYVLFPFYEESEQVYFQGRAAYPDLLADPKSKKKNPKSVNGIGKNAWLYGIEDAFKECTFVLVEGTLDRISAQAFLDREYGGSHVAVAIQGTSLSFPDTERHPLNSQWGKLMYYKPTEVLVLFDSDAYKKASELSKILTRTGTASRALKLENGDPNEVMRLEDGMKIMRETFRAKSEFEEILNTLSTATI